MAFGGGFDGQEEAEMSEINMTPLVDVMLVLLIIFMLTVPVLTHTVKVDLPQETQQKSQTLPQTIVLALTANGDLHWNDTPVSFVELSTKLAEQAQATPQPEIHLYGDSKVDYAHVVKLMAAVQKAGLTNIGFITEPQS